VEEELLFPDDLVLCVLLELLLDVELLVLFCDGWLVVTALQSDFVLRVCVLLLEVLLVLVLVEEFLVLVLLGVVELVLVEELLVFELLEVSLILLEVEFTFLLLV